MKKILLVSILASFSLHSWAQPDCQIDTAFVNSGALVDPLPFVNDTLGEGITVEACINTPYEFDVLLHAPSEIPFGGFTLPVTSIQIADVTNLPEGITYECSFPDCVIPGDSIGCIRLSGTPTEANDTGSYVLFIELRAAGIPIPITFPDTTGLLGLPEGSYTLRLNQEGSPNCDVISSSRQLDIHSLKVFPNPTLDQLTIDWTTSERQNTLLKIISSTGVVVRERTLGHTAGYRHEESIADLPAGFYMVGLSSNKGQTWKKVQKL